MSWIRSLDGNKKEYTKENKNQNTTIKICGETAKAMLREKFITLNAHIRK